MRAETRSLLSFAAFDLISKRVRMNRDDFHVVLAGSRKHQQQNPSVFQQKKRKSLLLSHPEGLSQSMIKSRKKIFDPRQSLEGKDREHSWFLRGTCSRGGGLASN